MDRYSRQMLFSPIGNEGQQSLRSSSALIVGVGALGNAIANHLARAGAGTLRLVDRDYVEWSNLGRQSLFDERDARAALPKAVAAERKLSAINSEVHIEAVVADATALTISDLIDGMDIVLDGTDNFASRYLLNDTCFKHGVPFVYGGAVASRGMSAPFVPGETPCLRCMLPDASGGATCDTAGVISPIVDLVAAYQSAEALKWLSGRRESMRRSLVTVDIWAGSYYEVKFGSPRESCPVCGKGEFPALEAAVGEEAVSLCGRETVQISGGAPLPLEEWEGRLSPVASVSRNPFLLRAELSSGERLVLFPDGRVLVQGTTDPVRAKSLYSRYIGN
ncbi:ThiF family adenylyltransferase [Paenibacillus alkalitolerans]|uniref:ThiF family adenylyltransferase n=1 Tax=Paenibacillus alkalitolerans TaxID=2799335 RepID=UPI002D804494|nr:ThiF family adenylyltransferase [Paenibacillus alkalitolerans]